MNIGIYIVGAERSGKTTLANWYLKKKNPKLVVNPSWDKKGIRINIINGFVYNLKNQKLDIGKLISQKKPLLIEQPTEIEGTKQLFEFISEYLGGGIVHFDDCRELFKHAPRVVGQLIRRKNHIITGNRRGVDLLFCFHQNSRASGEIIGLCKYAAIFQSIGDPLTGDSYLNKAIKKATQEVSKKDQYTFAFMDVIKKEYTFHKLSKKQINNSK